MTTPPPPPPPPPLPPPLNAFCRLLLNTRLAPVHLRLLFSLDSLPPLRAGFCLLSACVLESLPRSRSLTCSQHYLSFSAYNLPFTRAISDFAYCTATHAALLAAPGFCISLPHTAQRHCATACWITHKVPAAGLPRASPSFILRSCHCYLTSAFSPYGQRYCTRHTLTLHAPPACAFHCRRYDHAQHQHAFLPPTASRRHMPLRAIPAHHLPVCLLTRHLHRSARILRTSAAARTSHCCAELYRSCG